MKPEQQFWNLLKTHLPGFNKRVENIAGTGTPDIYSAWGTPFWIELKVYPNRLEPLQQIWHHKNLVHGGKSIVLTKIPGKKLKNQDPTPDNIMIEIPVLVGDTFVLRKIAMFPRPYAWEDIINKIRTAV